MAAELACATGAPRLYGDASDVLDPRPTYTPAKHPDLVVPWFAQAKTGDRIGFVAEPTAGASGSDKDRDRPGRGLSVNQTDRIIKAINTDLESPLHIQDLAALAALSTRHFSTAFKQSLGVSPHRYVLERRMERARELLAVSEHSIADITYQVGFSSQAHFTTMFRKLVGMTPGAFRTFVRRARDSASDS